VTNRTAVASSDPR